MDFEKTYQNIVKGDKKKDIGAPELFSFPKDGLLLKKTKRTLKSLPKDVGYDVCKYGGMKESCI